jgi:hypothetical protein
VEIERCHGSYSRFARDRSRGVSVLSDIQGRTSTGKCTRHNRRNSATELNP